MESDGQKWVALRPVGDRLESLFLVRRKDGEPIDDNLFYMANDWDEALSIAGEISAGEWGYGEGEYEILEVVVVRSETIAGDEEE